jgi:hypothetical protein
MLNCCTDGDGSREAYHSHAFNAVSWVLKGQLTEHPIAWTYYPVRQFMELPVNIYRRCFRPVHTPRNMMHKVESAGDTWVISFRGPWTKKWMEYLPEEHRFVTLTNGREELESYQEVA